MGYMPTGAIVVAILSLGMDGWGRYWMGLASLMLVGAMLVDHLDRRSAAKNLKVRR